MAKQGVQIKDALGNTRTILYEDSNATGWQLSVEVVSISGSVTPGVGALNLGKADRATRAAADVGVQALVARTDTPASLATATGQYTTLSVNALGALWVTPTPNATGGATLFRLLSAATTNATLVKSTAGQIFTIMASNTYTAARFLKLYNLTVAPTVGTSTPVMTIALPANWAGTLDFSDYGAVFSTGISLAITGAYADADTTAVAAGDVLLNITYK